jgi:hypothetical protein
MPLHTLNPLVVPASTWSQVTSPILGFGRGSSSSASMRLSAKEVSRRLRKQFSPYHICMHLYCAPRWDCSCRSTLLRSIPLPRHPQVRLPHKPLTSGRATCQWVDQSRAAVPPGPMPPTTTHLLGNLRNWTLRDCDSGAMSSTNVVH